MMFAKITAFLLVFTTAKSLSNPRYETNEFEYFKNLLFHPNLELIPYESCGQVKPSLISPRIGGGRDAEIEDFPWMVKFYLGDSHNAPGCGGSLINERYVLTAAHCCEQAIQLYGNASSVELGNKYTFKKSRTFAVEEITVHWNYFNFNGNATKNDICLLRLNETILFNDEVQPICLPFFEEMPSIRTGTEMEIAGWGILNMVLKDNKIYGKQPNILQHKKVYVMSIAHCRRGPPNFMTIVDSRDICVSGGACSGDSGGPLMKSFLDVDGIKTYFTFGVFAFYSPNCTSKDTAVYANIFVYLKWILNNIRK